MNISMLLAASRSSESWRLPLRASRRYWSAPLNVHIEVAGRNEGAQWIFWAHVSHALLLPRIQPHPVPPLRPVCLDHSLDAQCQHTPTGYIDHCSMWRRCATESVWELCRTSFWFEWKIMWRKSADFVIGILPSGNNDSITKVYIFLAKVNEWQINSRHYRTYVVRYSRRWRK
jgi:hypothetical protein